MHSCNASSRTVISARRLRALAVLTGAAMAGLASARAQAQVFVGGVSQGDSYTVTGNQNVTSPVTVLGDGNSFTPRFGQNLTTGIVYIDDSTDPAISNLTDHFGANMITMLGGSIGFACRQGGSTTTIQQLDVLSSATLTMLPYNGTAVLNIGNLTTSSTSTITFQSQNGNISDPSGSNGAIQITNLNGAAVTNTNGIIGGWATVTEPYNPTHFGTNTATGIQNVSGTVTFANATPTSNVDDGYSISGNNAGISGNTTINSLTSNSGDIFINGNGTVLTIQSGGVIMGGDYAHWIKNVNNGGSLTAGAGGNYNLFVTVNDGGADYEFNNVNVIDNGANAVSLVKGGVGKLQLNSQSTYSGSTIVNAGTLQLDYGNQGGAIAGGGPIVVYSGATLASNSTDGLGYFNNNGYTNGITINEGGTLTDLGGSRLSMDRNLTVIGGTIAATGAGDGAGTYAFRDSQGAKYNFTSAADGTASTISAINVGLQGTTTFNVTPGGGPVNLNVTGTLIDIFGTGSLVKTGNGVMALSAANTYSGGTTVKAGTLQLNFAASGAPASNILNSSGTLTLGGGALSITGNASGTTAQTFNALTLNSGTSSSIAVNSNGGTATNLSLGNINWNGGTTVNFTLPTAGNVTTTSTYNTDTVYNNYGPNYGLLVSQPYNWSAFATVNQTTWAMNNSSSSQQTSGSGTTGSGIISGLPTASYATSVGYNGGDNVDVQSSQTSGGYYAGTLRFNNPNVALALLPGTTDIDAGGILVTANGNGSSITGNSIGANGGGGRLVVINYANSFTIASAITGSSNGVTFTGTGTTILTGANSYTSTTSVQGGVLRATNLAGPLVVGTGSANSGTIAVGPDANTAGTLALSSTSATHELNGGGTYAWKITGVGTGGVAAATGSSGSVGVSTGSGTEGTDWDLITTASGSTLDLSSLSSSNQFTIAPTGNITSGAQSYSWVIAEAPVGGINMPGGYAAPSGATPSADLTNGGSGGAFVLNTSGLTDASNSPLAAWEFSLEVVNIGSNEDLVLDYSGTPEPGTTILVLGGTVPMLMGRRDRRRTVNDTN